MILKEKEGSIESDVRIRAGNNHEKDVAFYLRREFASRKEVFVLNDVHVEHNGERAQIDHLIIHSKGFIVIESKSITGEVRVNAEGEWSRSYNGQWRGMASPIRQAELQSDLLKSWLNAKREEYFDKLPLIGVTLGVAGFEWRVLCAVSSNAILHREKMAKDISERIVKAEFIAVKVKEYFSVSKLRTTLASTPLYSLKAMQQVSGFIAASQPANVPMSADLVKQVAAETPKAEIVKPAPDDAGVKHIVKEKLVCKKCGKSDLLSGESGRFGYYLKCGHCQSNTPMKTPCQKCHSSATKISKSKEVFRLKCEACGFGDVIFGV